MVQSARPEPLRGPHDIWRTLVAVGFVSTLAGVVVLVWPDITLVTLAVVTGVFLLVDGALEIVRALRSHGDEGYALLALLGALSVIAGLIFIKHPFNTIEVFVLVLGAWFVVVGVTRFVMAFAEGEGRLTGIVVGLLEVLAGVVVLAYPDLGLRAAAALAGILLIVRGLALIWGGRQIRAAATA